MAGFVERAKRSYAAARERWGWLDHLVRAKAHYDLVRGDRLAAAVTYFAFLSFFPLLALAFAVVGYLVAVYPDIERQVTDLLTENFPGLIGSGPNQLDVAALAGNRTTAGVIGLVGLLLSGLGWISALREAVRRVWSQGPPAANFLVQKVRDAIALVLFGLALLTSLAVSSVATSTTGLVLGWLGLEGSTPAAVGFGVLAVALALLANMLLFLVVLGRLSDASVPRGDLLRGALLGAVGTEVLKLVGTFLVGRTTANPVYASVAVVVGLLIWLDLIGRFVLFVACWTRTRSAGEAPAAALPETVHAPARVAPRPRRRSPRAALLALGSAVAAGWLLGRRSAGRGD